MDNNKNKELFEKFKSTGNIKDYLEYSKHKRKHIENEENNEKYWPNN